MGGTFRYSTVFGPNERAIRRSLNPRARPETGEWRPPGNRNHETSNRGRGDFYHDRNRIWRTAHRGPYGIALKNLKRAAKRKKNRSRRSRFSKRVGCVYFLLREPHAVHRRVRVRAPPVGYWFGHIQ